MKKTSIFILILPLLFSFKSGNEIDAKKMNRDLEIAKNIFATLIKSGSGNFFGSQSIEASYIKDFGVVFTIPEHLVYFSTGGDHFIHVPEVPPMPEMNFQFEFKFDEVDSSTRLNDEKMRAELDKAKEQVIQKKEEIVIAREKARVAVAESRELRGFAESGVEKDINWEEVMITFMTDYADLIGQLQPEDKIVINQKSPSNQFVMVWRGDSKTEHQRPERSSISAEVVRKDLTAFKSGKINRDEFIKHISITKKEPQKKIADLEMFAGIFDKYYSYDLSETFYVQGKPAYEVLKGFGAIFQIKAFSPNQSYTRMRFYAPGATTSSSGTSTDKNEVDEEALYPKFKEDLINFMLDYGRTIRSLKDSDKLLLEIKIQACKDCKVPSVVEVSTKMSTLRQYDEQKISKQKAAGMIEIKEVF